MPNSKKNRGVDSLTHQAFEEVVKEHRLSGQNFLTQDTDFFTGITLEVNKKFYVNFSDLLPAIKKAIAENIIKCENKEITDTILSYLEQLGITPEDMDHASADKVEEVSTLIYKKYAALRPHRARLVLEKMYIAKERSYASVEAGDLTDKTINWSAIEHDVTSSTVYKLSELETRTQEAILKEVEKLLISKKVNFNSNKARTTALTIISRIENFSAKSIERMYIHELVNYLYSCAAMNQKPSSTLITSNFQLWYERYRESFVGSETDFPHSIFPSTEQVKPGTLPSPLKDTSRLNFTKIRLITGVTIVILFILIILIICLVFFLQKKDS